MTLYDETIIDRIKNIVGDLFGWIIWWRVPTEKWGTFPGGGNPMPKPSNSRTFLRWVIAVLQYAIRYDQKGTLVPFNEWFRASLANYIQTGKWGTRWEWTAINGEWEKVEIPRTFPRLRGFKT